ncbi:MAG TPA: ATP-binding protein, partial [Bacteroidales bacterium]|nr:ATP-binding protein [Bacteroidales bacterium]
ITLIEEKRHVYIEVQDTGKGINSKYQKKIFKPGFTTKNRGWGLGLTLSLRIIKNYHKGKINVKKSTSNKGTTFRIKLKK